MKSAVITCAIIGVCGACLYTHRRVIKAVIDGEPMPKAPDWHFWVKPENRRGSESGEGTDENAEN